MRLFRRPRPSPLASPRTAPLPEPPAQLPSVLVAVNGQAGTLDTVAWAAAEASTRRVGLHILHVARWPVIVDPYGAAQVESQIHDPAQRILDQALEQARQVGPELPVSTHLATGTPARAIAHAAEHAALIVLGRHHKRHRLPRRSVTQQVAARSHRPIAVAGFGEPARPGPSAARVVVAVDCVHDTMAAMALLGAAFSAAHRRGVGVTVLADARSDIDTGTGPGSDASTLEDLLRLHAQAFHDLDVRHETSAGPLASVLQRESQAAALLVLANPRHPLHRLQFRPDVDYLLRTIRAPITFVPTRPQGRVALRR